MKKLKLTPDAVQALRKELGLNQSDFWKPIGVTQSGGSRYESGRNIAKPVQLLIRLAYGTKAESDQVFSKLRENQSL